MHVYGSDSNAWCNFVKSVSSANSTCDSERLIQVQSFGTKMAKLRKNGTITCFVRFHLLYVCVCVYTFWSTCTFFTDEESPGTVTDTWHSGLPCLRRLVLGAFFRCLVLLRCLALGDFLLCLSRLNFYAFCLRLTWRSFVVMMHVVSFS